MSMKPSEQNIFPSLLIQGEPIDIMRKEASGIKLIIVSKSLVDKLSKSSIAKKIYFEKIFRIEAFFSPSVKMKRIVRTYS